MNHVGLIYGGRSPEHEVSILSARNVFAALDPARYRVTPIRIDRAGRWHIETAGASGLHGAEPGGDRALLSPREAGAEMLRGAGGSSSRLEALDLDVAFPVLHGQNGEDGRVQGVLQTLGLPYVGADVLGSAACMDKEVTKRLLRDAGLPVVPFLIARPHDRPAFAEVTAALGPGLFVKPAGSGSSVGTSKVDAEADYVPALDHALSFDNKALIEQAVTGREVECAVIGNEEPRTAPLGEIVSTAAFYTYDAKYQDPDAARMEVPADVPEAVSDRIRALAADAYRVLGCEGMARVDFFVTPEHHLFVNEINTIPGFTARSMFPVMWEHAGLPLGALLDTLLQLALDRHARDARLRTAR